MQLVKVEIFVVLLQVIFSMFFLLIQMYCDRKTFANCSILSQLNENYGGDWRQIGQACVKLLPACPTFITTCFII